MFSFIKSFFSKIKEAFVYAFSKKDKIVQTVEESQKTIEQLKEVIAEYEKANADNQITLSEMFLLMEKVKIFLAQFEKSQDTYNSIFE